MDNNKDIVKIVEIICTFGYKSLLLIAPFWGASKFFESIGDILSNNTINITVIQDVNVSCEIICTILANFKDGITCES